MTNNSNGRLSEYFANDPPSFFDELTTNNKSKSTAQVAEPPNRNMLSSSTFTGCFQPPEYVETAEADEEPIKVNDEVRNLWPLPTTLNDLGSYQAKHLTLPGIHNANDLVSISWSYRKHKNFTYQLLKPDPIAVAVVQQLGESELQHRKILGVENVTQDERGIRTLINAGCFRAAVNLTGRLLTIYGQGYGRAGQPAKHSPHSLQLWFTRLALLAKLDEYDLLQAEAEPFGQLNGPDVFYEFYPEMYPGKHGSIACFSFRLLLAELPIYLGKPHLALDQLSELHVTSTDIKEHFERLKNVSASEFWQRRAERVLQSIINCALMVKIVKSTCRLLHYFMFALCR